MKISFTPTINIYQQSFGTKKPEIRKADDIQRKTREVFPFFSPSYAENYYTTCKTNYDARHLTSNQAKKLYDLRCERYKDQTLRTPFTTVLQKTINDVRKKGLANCGEAAIITMSTLIANGFPNTHRCAVVLNTSLIDKKTKKEVFSREFDVDHACTITTMDTNPRMDKPYIVVDSWNGFADSTSGAVTRYIRQLNKTDMKKYTQKAINEYKEQCNAKKKRFINPKDLEIKHNIDFAVIDSPDKKEEKKIQKLIRTKYPALIVEPEVG
ncbi:hypothetical protein IKQ26_05995 [bacterium]|nr:hypothetical protein [bacterium]